MTTINQIKPCCGPFCMRHVRPNGNAQLRSYIFFNRLDLWANVLCSFIFYIISRIICKFKCETFVHKIHFFQKVVLQKYMLCAVVDAEHIVIAGRVQRGVVDPVAQVQHDEREGEQPATLAIDVQRRLPTLQVCSFSFPLCTLFPPPNKTGDFNEAKRSRSVCPVASGANYI